MKDFSLKTIYRKSCKICKNCKILLKYLEKICCSLVTSNKPSRFFPGTFLQLVNGTKNSILKWVMKLNLFMCFFSFLFFKYPWKVFHSIHLFFLLFGLDTNMLKGKLYVSYQLTFLQNSPQNFKIPRKIHKKCIFQQSVDLNIKKGPFVVYHGVTPWCHWTKQAIKKLNFWWETALDKTTWIKVWPLLIMLHSTT